MKDSFKNKNILVIIFELLIIALGIIGITFATSKLLDGRAATLITTDEYNLDYVGDNYVTISDIYPMDDSLVNFDTTDNVIRLAFSVRGVKTNNDDKLIYDVMLNEMDIDCSLLNKYTKWNLYKNGKLISNGSLDPLFDGDVLSDSMRLTTIQENLPRYDKDYDNYVLIFWISESCDDLETCEIVDQSNILNSKMSMKVFIALYSGAKKKYERVPNYDGTCANKPELYNNMVPINYNNGEWVVAEEKNSNEYNLWYSYASGKWANAVIVNDVNKYRNVGTTIDSADVLGYFVWIPRFRYKLWNAESERADSYNAYDDGIEIIFENGLNSTNNEIANNNYLTHPAFGEKDRGFWISKYEISKQNETYRFIGGADSYRNDTFENYQSIATSISDSYKLGNKAESHMVNNLEWGATLYLSHSKYGVCAGDGCSSIDTNATYISGNNRQDTTTRNIYGVYDMAGASGEYVLGKSTIGTATSEVKLLDGNTWYNGMGMVSDRDYIIRGGISRSLFYFGDIRMDDTENSTRVSLVAKKGD